MSGFLDSDIFEIEVQKTKQYYDKAISNDANIVKFVLSDDEVDYSLDLEDIYNSKFFKPLTVNEGIKNEITFDNSNNPEIILDNFNISFDLLKEKVKSQEINITVSNGKEESGYVIENNYQDFISIVNTGSITAGDLLITDKYVDSNYNILNNTTRYQLVGSKFTVYITNNININQKIFEINIYSLTYPIQTTLLIKF